MPVTSFQAICIHKCAIFGPTPGNLQSPSIVLGMSLLYLLFNISVDFLMYCTFL